MKKMGLVSSLKIYIRRQEFVSISL